MLNKQQREQAFITELKELLARHDAEIELEETDRRAYIGSTYEIVVSLYAEYNKEHKCIKEHTEINLGTFINGD